MGHHRSSKSHDNDSTVNHVTVTHSPPTHDLIPSTSTLRWLLILCTCLLMIWVEWGTPHSLELTRHERYGSSPQSIPQPASASLSISSAFSSSSSSHIQSCIDEAFYFQSSSIPTKPLLPSTAAPVSIDLADVYQREKAWLETMTSTATASVTLASMLREKLSGRWIHMIGDSTMRYTFYAFVELLQSAGGSVATSSSSNDSERTAAAAELHVWRQKHRHEDQEIWIDVRSGSGWMRLTNSPQEFEPGGSSAVYPMTVGGQLSADDSTFHRSPSFIHLSFEWSPFIRNATSSIRRILPQHPDLVVVSSGLWDLLNSPDGSARRSFIPPSSSPIINAWNEQTERMLIQTLQHESSLIQVMVQGAIAGQSSPSPPLTLWLSSPSLLEDRLTAHRLAAQHFRNERLRTLNQYVNDKLLKHLSFIHYVNLHPLTSLRPAEENDDGVHSLWASKHVSLALAEFSRCILATI